jgi:hypothetical protein
MKLTNQEKKLLRQQAEAYAFIYDLRRTAIMKQDITYVRLTEGIDTRVAKRQKEYPTLFKRYFNEALKRAESDRMSGLKAIQKVPVKTYVKREETPRREKESKKETQARVPRRRVRQRLTGGDRKDKPE